MQRLDVSQHTERACSLCERSPNSGPVGRFESIQGKRVQGQAKSLTRALLSGSGLSLYQIICKIKRCKGLKGCAMAKNVRDFAIWAEQVIARVITGEGLSADQALPGSSRAPLTLAASLRKALRVEAVRVSEGTGGHLVTVDPALYNSIGGSEKYVTPVQPRKGTGYPALAYDNRLACADSGCRLVDGLILALLADWGLCAHGSYIHPAE